MAEIPPEHPSGSTTCTSKLQEALPRWTAQARVEQRALERAREASLRRQAAESATVAGCLLDLAERGAAVGITTVAGRNLHGTITTVGLDYVRLASLWHRDVIVPFAAILVIRPKPGDAEALGGRPPAADLTLGEALAELAHDRPRMVLALRTPDQTVSGELRSVGADVVNVSLDGPEPVVASIPLAALAEISTT